jgi:hypothetical protein
MNCRKYVAISVLAVILTGYVATKLNSPKIVEDPIEQVPKIDSVKRDDFEPPSPRKKSFRPSAKPDGVTFPQSETHLPDTLTERLSRFNHLRMKALLTREEEAELQSHLSDVDLIHSCSGRLSSHLANHTLNFGDRKTEQLRRMDAVDFLRRALQWSKNPSKDDVLDAFTYTLESEDIDTIQSDRWLKRSIAGDKIELLVALQRVEPEMVDSISSRLTGKKIFDYIIPKRDVGPVSTFVSQ